jgi:hypothetical protein
MSEVGVRLDAAIFCHYHGSSRADAEAWTSLHECSLHDCCLVAPRCLEFLPARCRDLHCALSWGLTAKARLMDSHGCSPLLTLATQPQVFNAFGRLKEI